MHIRLLGGLDDINKDNSAKLWWMRERSKLNEEMFCHNICELVTTSELLDLIRGDSVNVEENCVRKLCIFVNSDLCICGANQIEREEDIGWDIWEDGEETQHEDRCVNCGATRLVSDWVKCSTNETGTSFGTWMTND